MMGTTSSSRKPARCGLEIRAPRQCTASELTVASYPFNHLLVRDSKLGLGLQGAKDGIEVMSMNWGVVA